MPETLLKAACFIGIMLLGFLLRSIGFFKEGDFHVLSKIALKITLPAAIVVSFSEMKMETSMLIIVALGFGGGIIYLLLALIMNVRASKDRRAFEILNLPGYNIGLFAMPFVSEFVGAAGVVATSLFDTGNAFICLGGSYGIAKSVKEGQGFSFGRILVALLTSVPFMTYIIMIILNLSGFRLPKEVLSFAEIIRSANTFIAMLMIGVGFRLRADMKQLGQILRIVFVRYLIAALLAGLYYHVFTFLSMDIRKALVLLAFSPISAAVPAFTAEMKGDAGLSSAVNSICIVCSIVIMTVLMTII